MKDRSWYERDRLATLVIVPDAAWRDSQIIMVEPETYEGVAHVLAVLGVMMAERRTRGRPRHS